MLSGWNAVDRISGKLTLSDKSPSSNLGHSAHAQSEPRIELPDQIAYWKLEPELACPGPREVVLRAIYLRGPLFGIVCLMAGAFLLWVAHDQLFALFILGGAPLVGVFTERKRRISRLLVASGLATRGVVVDEDSSNTGEGGPVTVWTVAYDTTDGQRLTLVLGPYDKRYGNVAVGYALTILYLPESPKRAMPYKECYYTAVPLGGR